MKRTIPFLLVLVSLAACDEEPVKSSVVPTAPAATASAPAASVAAAAASSGSTICRVYATEYDVAKTALDAAPADTLLQRRVTTLDALVKETCN